jgi:hypothetical protein
MTVQIKYDNIKQCIVIELPIERHIRVKQREIKPNCVVITDVNKDSITSNLDENLKKNCYIEWQIKYKDQTELPNIVKIAYKYGIIIREDIKELKEFAETFKDNLGEYFNNWAKEKFEKDIRIKCEDCIEAPKKLRDDFKSFTLYSRNYPFIVIPQDAIEKLDSPFIIIEYRSRQKVRGMQPMIYVGIPMITLDSIECNKSINKAKFRISNGSKEFIKTLLKVFIYISDSHRNDILKLLEKLEQ